MTTAEGKECAMTTQILILKFEYIRTVVVTILACMRMCTNTCMETYQRKRNKRKTVPRDH